MIKAKKLAQIIARPITDKVLKLKNTYRGESCYIFGDGISIKWMNLSLLPRRPSFTLSCIPFHSQSRDLDIRFALLIEPWYFYPIFPMPVGSPYKWWRNRINTLYTEFSASNPHTNIFINISNYPFFRGRNVFHLFRKINDPGFQFMSQCLENDVEPFEGSLTTSITLAIFMGFKEIMLVGCDYTHGYSRSLHWYEIGQGVLTDNDDYLRDFFEIASKYVKIETLALDSASSVLKAISYESYTGYSPSYRENHELIERKALKLLKTWPGYAI